MSHEQPATATPPSPVDISSRSDRENMLILILVAIGLLYLLVRTAELKPDKPMRPAPGGPAATRR